MSAPQDDALAAAVAEHGPFPMPVGEPMPVKLTDQQLDALIDAGNQALNDHYHEGQCHCDAWPTSCVSSDRYFMGAWDTDAFAIGVPAVLGVWESLRNDRHAAKVAELRAERTQLQDDITGACLARYEEEQENDRLRARVAELEAARTTAAADRDRQIIAWLEKKAREEGTSNKDSRVRATATYRLADKLSRGAVRPACPPVSDGSPWERAVAGLNALVDADVIFHVEPDGHISAPFSDEHIEWDRKAKRWVLTRDDEDEGLLPLPTGTAERAAVDRSIIDEFPGSSVDSWNAQHPVGTPVVAYPGCRPEDDPKCTRLVTRTRSAASVLGGHTAVVWVEGHSACISLTHVDPRPGGAS